MAKNAVSSVGSHHAETDGARVRFAFYNVGQANNQVGKASWMLQVNLLTTEIRRMITTNQTDAISVDVSRSPPVPRLIHWRATHHHRKHWLQHANLSKVSGFICEWGWMKGSMKDSIDEVLKVIRAIAIILCNAV